MDEDLQDELDSIGIDELARAFGLCLTCCDAGIVGAQLEDCEHG